MSQTKSKFIEDNAVTTAKINASAVTDAKVATGINANKIGAGSVDNTKFGYLSNVTSDIQAQINAGTGANNTLSNLASTTDVTSKLRLNPSPAGGSGLPEILVSAPGAGIAGSNFSVRAGASGTGTNIAGGNLILLSGSTTGNQSSKVTFGAVPAGTSGTGTNSAQTSMELTQTTTSVNLLLSPLSGNTGLNLTTASTNATVQPFTFNNGSQVGTLNLLSGTNNGGGNTGDINLKSSDGGVTAGGSGNINIASGLTTVTGAQSGSVNIASGTVANGNTIITGAVTVSSGAGLANDTPSGVVILSSGATTGTGAPSGTVSVVSGNTSGTTSASGIAKLASGTTNGTTSGQARMETGNNASGASGGINIITGSATTNSGAITLTTGSGATRGSITLNSGGTSYSNFLYLQGAVRFKIGNEVSNLTTPINALDPLGNTIYIINQTGATTLNGITAGNDGQYLILINYALFALTINNDNASAAAADRIITQTGGAILSTTASSHQFVYSTTKGRWIYLGGQL